MWNIPRFKWVCLLSQLHLSFFIGSVQKAQLYLYAVCHRVLADTPGARGTVV